MFFYRDILYLRRQRKQLLTLFVAYALMIVLDLSWNNLIFVSFIPVFLEIDLGIIKSDKHAAIFRRLSASYGTLQLHVNRIISLYMIHIALNSLPLCVYAFIASNASGIMTFIILFSLGALYTIISYLTAVFIENEIIALTVILASVYALSLLFAGWL